MLQNHIEALIFCSPNPINVADIKNCLVQMFDKEISEENIKDAIQHLSKKYEDDNFAFQLYPLAGGYQFMTKPAYQAGIGIMLKQLSKKRLSSSALETLSIIAYKHPVSKPDIEKIRGVNCDYTIRRLLEKGLITMAGKADSIGKPRLYSVSAKFMEYFGLNDISELPSLNEFSPEGENTIGIPLDH